MTETLCNYPERDELLVSYLYEDIDSAERSAFGSHLSTCHYCLEDLSALRGIRDNAVLRRMTLVSALRFMAIKKMEAGVVTSVKEAHLIEEAHRRIIMAMFIDNMELDSD